MAGAPGPSLARFGYKQGDSDLAVYRVLRDGIPGTAMVANGFIVRAALATGRVFENFAIPP